MLYRVIWQLLPEHFALARLRGNCERFIEYFLLLESPPLQVLIHFQEHALFIEAQLILVLVQLFHGLFALRVEVEVKLLVFVDIASFLVQEQRLEFL